MAERLKGSRSGRGARPRRRSEGGATGRTARIEIPEVGSSSGEPIIDPNSGQVFHAGFKLPNGFQLTEAEVGSGSTDLKAGIELHLSGSHAHFAGLHMNQDGVVRQPARAVVPPGPLFFESLHRDPIQVPPDQAD